MNKAATITGPSLDHPGTHNRETDDETQIYI
jgi:hypothetical protein